MNELLDEMLTVERKEELKEAGWKTAAAAAALAGSLATFGIGSAHASGVVVDPGHGGHDPGAVYQSYREKDINLDVAKLIADKLIGSIVTREGDIYVPVSRRAEIANKADVDLFVSIHTNSSENPPSTGGPEVLYYADSPRGKELASRIRTALGGTRALVPIKSKEERGYGLLKGTKMPAVIVELGFINSDEDRKYLLDADWREKTADKIARVVRDFQSKMDKG